METYIWLYKELRSEYDDLFQTFKNVLKCKRQARLLGQKNRPAFGISDGNKGVQWNLAVFPDIGDIQLGVNLEGSEKTGKWLIAPFILSELSNPTIEAVKLELDKPGEIFLRFSRDAWQCSSRPKIKEEFLGGKEFSLLELDTKRWKSILEEALTCLDPDKGYRGRIKKQIVTLASNGMQKEKEVSPHLTIVATLELDGNRTENIKQRIADLKPLYDWVVRVSHSKLSY